MSTLRKRQVDELGLARTKFSRWSTSPRWQTAERRALGDALRFPYIMNYVDWLERTAPGFTHLDEHERQAILHFALLWSLFEARALRENASAQAILHLVQTREAEGRLNAGEFDASLRYFRQRYFANGGFTDYFQGLHFRKNDHQQMVQEVLSGQSQIPAACVASLLILVYRLRNNLFHGLKWAYGIQGQRENFEHANAALVVAINQLSEYGG